MIREPPTVQTTSILLGFLAAFWFLVSQAQVSVMDAANTTDREAATNGRRGSKQVAAELEARFGRFDEERKAARDQLQTRFVRWGLGLFALGVVTIIVGIIASDADLHAVLGPLSSAFIMVGMLTMTMADHDLDEVFSRRHCLSVPFPAVSVLFFASLSLRRSLAFMLAALPSLYLAVRHRRVLGRATGSPRWTQLILVYSVSILSPLGYVHQAGASAGRRPAPRRSLGSRRVLPARRDHHCGALPVAVEPPHGPVPVCMALRLCR
jgi:hypothetical protein